MIIKPNTKYTEVDTTSSDVEVTLSATTGLEQEYKNIGAAGYDLTIIYGTDTLVLTDGQCASFTYGETVWNTFSAGSLQTDLDALGVRVTTNESDISTNETGIVNLQGNTTTVSASVSFTITTDVFNDLLDASTISASGQTITLVEGTSITRLNTVQVYNGSSESVDVTDGTDTFTLVAGQYSNFFFEDSTLNQTTTIADISGQAVSTTLVSMTGNLSTDITELEKTVTIPDTVSTQYTLTLSAGTGIDVSRYIWVRNRSSEIQIVTDGTTTYWVSERQRVKFYFDEDSSLVWASAGWEKVYKDYDNASSVDWADILRGTSTTLPDGLYRALSCAGNPESGTSGNFTQEVTYDSDFSADCFSNTNSASSNARLWIDISAHTVGHEDTPDVRVLWLWHDAA